MLRTATMLATTTIVLGLCTPAFAHDYELKDLEALEKQESWHEALQHLGDIPPSKRNDTWQRIAEKASAGELLALAQASDKSSGSRNQEARQVLILADDVVKRFPSLKKSKSFMQARADAGLKAFGKTYSDSHHSSSDDPWLEQLKAFVEADTLTADLPLRAGKLVTSRLVAYIAVPFFKKAIAANAGACKDADVKKALTSAIVDNVWGEDAKALADKSCWNDVKGSLEAELAKGTDEAKKYACPLFASKKVANAACK